MFRKITSIILTVSFIAMASSGLIMLVGKGSALPFQMHPVHNIFAIVMLIAGIIHLILNIKPIINYLKLKSALITGTVLTVITVLLFIAGLSREMDPRMLQRFSEMGPPGHENSERMPPR